MSKPHIRLHYETAPRKFPAGSARWSVDVWESRADQGKPGYLLLRYEWMLSVGQALANVRAGLNRIH